MGGSDVVHRVRFSLTVTACSCLTAFGTEWDFHYVNFTLFTVQYCGALGVSPALLFNGPILCIVPRCR